MGWRLRVCAALAAAGMATGMVTGCSAGADRVTVATDSPPAPASHADPVGPTAAYVTESPGSPADRDLFARLQAFAREPSPERFARVRFAEEVALGLGGTAEKTVGRGELADRAVWVLDRTSYGGVDGPFSALDTLRTGGDATVVAGPHNHCAGVPTKFPAPYSGMRQVSGHRTTRDSCIGWWSVELFVDADGRIAGVFLDLWEP